MFLRKMIVVTSHLAQLLGALLSVSACLGFDSRAGKIGHSVAIGSQPLRRFFGAVLARR